MSDEIIKVLDALCEKLGVVVDWTGETVLPQIQELGTKAVAYECATSKIWLVVGILILIIGVGLFILAGYLISDCEEEMGGLSAVLGTIACGLAFVIIGSQIGDLILCNTFPEKIIYRLISDALK